MQLGFSFGSSQSETRVVRKLRIRIDAGGGFSNSNRTGDRRHNTDDGSASFSVVTIGRAFDQQPGLSRNLAIL